MKDVMKRDWMTEFREALMAGIDNICKAAQVYVAAIDENPRLADQFAESFKDTIPNTAWAAFEAVGRRWMHPKLIMGGGGRYATKIKRLPYSTQERIFDGDKFDLLTAQGDVLKVDVRDCMPEQVEQLLDGSEVRTLAQQKAWMLSHKEAGRQEEVEAMPYIISNGKVVFRRGTVMNKAELRRVLTEM